MIARPVLILLLAGVLLAAECPVKENGGGNVQPVAGELAISLTTPNTDDGAILVKITATGGKTLSTVGSPCTGCRIFSAAVGTAEVRVVVTGTVAAGTIARVAVSDINSKTSYTVQVLDVASRTYVKRATTGYGVTLQ